MERLVVVSCDGHCGPPVEQFGPYMDPKYRPMVAELVQEEKDLQVFNSIVRFDTPERLNFVDPRERIASGGYSAGWDTERRLAELDAEGIAAEILFPGTTQSMTPFFYQFNKAYSEDVRFAGVKAYHRWLIDFMAPSNGRLIGTAEPGPTTDMDATLAEIRFAAEHGFRGVFVPGSVRQPGLPPLTDKYYEPLWATCNELNLVLTVHAGWGVDQGRFTDLIVQVKEFVAAGGSDGLTEAWNQVMGGLDDENPLSMFALTLGPRQIIWQLIFSGVFDRYPNLKLQVAECRADWVPELKAYLDRRFLAAPNRPRLQMKPSAYFGRNVFIAPSSPRRLEAELRHDIGIDTLMFAADLPHPESTWPNTLAWLQAVFYDVPEPELRKILGENAIGIYSLDETMLKNVASKIGYKPSDIIGQHSVDERLIADFDVRAGFNSETPPFDMQSLNSRVNADLAVTSA